MKPRALVEPFGTTRDGRAVELVSLINALGTRVAVLTYGGVLQAIELAGPDGSRTDVVLGFPHLEQYEQDSPYFGALIGRYANRILDARFELDGIEYRLDRNDEFGTVHGGSTGFDKHVWTATAFESDRSSGVRLGLRSPAGDNGFPGALDVEVTYELRAESDVLRIRYEAVTDAPTVVTLTGHTYFNLAGEGSGSILDHVLQIDADEYLPVTDQLVPTGRFAPVEGTPFDFRQPTRIGDRIRIGHDQLRLGHGYDHNYVLRDGGAGPEVQRAARVLDPGSGRTLEVWTTEPGIDVYTGNFLDGTLVGKSGSTYRQGDAIALEPEHFTNSPNTANFPSTVLRPGEVYRSTTEYRFG